MFNWKSCPYPHSNQMQSNFSFQAVFILKWFVYTNKLIRSYPKNRWKRNFIHEKANRIETNKKNVTDLWTYHDMSQLIFYPRESQNAHRVRSVSVNPLSVEYVRLAGTFFHTSSTVLIIISHNCNLHGLNLLSRAQQILSITVAFVFKFRLLSSWF